MKQFAFVLLSMLLLVFSVSSTHLLTPEKGSEPIPLPVILPSFVVEKTSTLPWSLRLVNFENPLPGDFTVSIESIHRYPDRKFDARAVDEMNALLADAERAGFPLYLVSAYRSFSYQSALFTRKVNEYMNKGFSFVHAEQEAAKWVARPGYSEHNLGLAADMVSKNWYASHSDLTADFEETAEFAWLYKHCAEYGFILRYPKDTVAITGVEYEPWHYRYVGREAAQTIMQKQCTLEEYVKTL